MAIEAWELNRYQQGQTNEVGKLSAFRTQFGDNFMPKGEWFNEADRTYVQVENEINQRLPYAPLLTRQYLTDAYYRSVNMQDLKIRPRDVKGEDWIKRSEAILVAYYGTDATAEDIAQAFSLPHAKAVTYQVERYFKQLYWSDWQLKQDYKASNIPVKKLDSPLVVPEKPDDGSVIKNEQDFWHYFRRSFKPDARAVMDLIEEGKGVILDNGHGLSKTYNLAPETLRLARSLGYAADSFDVALYKDATHYARHLDEYAFHREDPNASKKLMILDEFQAVVLQHPEVAKGMLQALKERNIMPFCLIPRPTQEVRTQVINFTKEAGAEVGYDFATHKIKITHIPSDLAKKGLELSGAEQELIDFVLNPENSTMLTSRMLTHALFHIRTLDDLRESLWHSAVLGASIPAWRFYLEHGQAGGSKEELQRMLINIGILNEEMLKQPWVKNIPDWSSY